MDEISKIEKAFPNLSETAKGKTVDLCTLIFNRKLRGNIINTPPLMAGGGGGGAAAAAPGGGDGGLMLSDEEEE